jgi:hypothetical protein
MLQNQPTIFISSTIYDFRDLRSALKYWLEELGYKVLLSEFNDFTKPLDENSYNACLKSIESADYFILLVGSRTGGFYNSKEKVSITRKEYRTAYDIVKSGKLKLITFVRADLWAIKEDRKALEKYLAKEFAQQKEIDSSDIEGISKYQSTFVNDAESTFSFLNEIGRIDEMKSAISGTSDFPVANWIHPFSTFQDIIETLGTVFNTKRKLAVASLIINVKRELYTNLIKLSEKLKDGEIDYHTLWANPVRDKYNSELNGTSYLPLKYIVWLKMFVAISMTFTLQKVFIEQAISSGTFLEFDFSTNDYKAGLIHNSLLNLKQNIDKLPNSDNNTFFKVYDKFLDKYHHIKNSSVNPEQQIQVENLDLFRIFANYDTQQNIAMLCIGLIRAFDGDISRLEDLKLNPSSPSATEYEKIKAETISIEEIEDWINKQ